MTCHGVLVTTAYVRRENNECVVGMSVARQSGDDTTDSVVHRRHHGAVHTSSFVLDVTVQTLVTLGHLHAHKKNPV